ncbi:N-acetylmuramoyl-L-alanine amidase [Youngiibacter multivorans]|uniref:N-acetylmuramoyl-L-alanine amidase n=1 Tax=Youngiibacter multivorans TaxID=937251 RepID=A0ABS4G7W7_9CLOT|nr:N-acetylmuramoyl-L-alanine amidase [Youngiibacter multivorans]MBP1920644.1 N-acetylmuramoyl-L-alanine amidase [Youngiibacter multivorans]
MGTKKIYLSPSNQPDNKYVVGNTNEKFEMEAVAVKIKQILDAEYECETVVATTNLTINASGRPKEAKDKGCDVYLAIHSNAGGKGKASGAVAFYHPNSDGSKELSRNIVRELNAICPIRSNRDTAVKNGMELYAGYGLAEVRNPNKIGITAVLAETDFHDNPATAKWIIDNKDKIARAYVEALVKTFGITKKVQTTEGKLYRVQAGAFKEKENAEALVTKLKAAGFESFIKYD